MEMKKKTILAVTALTFAMVMIFTGLGYAGSLTPPAAPAPTMKTLDEVEPRIPIPGSDTPIGPFNITKSGSYYLTGDRNASSTGINVFADNVTIDLAGFALIGSGTGTPTGIAIGMGTHSNVEIRNGTVRNFGGTGIYENSSTDKGHRIISLRVLSNGGSGIYLNGIGHLVKDCTASNNGTSATTNVYGIYANRDSTVSGCTVDDNGNSATLGNVYGISVGNGSMVSGNTSNDNGSGAAYSVYGIQAGEGSTITGNTAYYNGDYAFIVYGIYTGIGNTVTGNTVCYNGDFAFNTTYGIFLGGGNLVDHNTAYLNGLGFSSSTNMTLGVVGCVYGINVAP